MLDNFNFNLQLNWLNFQSAFLSRLRILAIYKRKFVKLAAKAPDFISLNRVQLASRCRIYECANNVGHWDSKMKQLGLYQQLSSPLLLHSLNRIEVACPL